MTDRLSRVCDSYTELLYDIAANIDRQQYQAALDLIMQCQGKVIFTGVGKAGMVAHKAAATVAFATKCKSVYLDAGAAIHGEMGLIDEDDIVVAISRSGHSTEVMQMLQTALHHINPTVICITEHDDSPIAKVSDVVLALPITKELDKFDMVVTASFVAALVVCDAIALQIMDEQSVDMRELGSRHPAGAIGEKYATELRKG